VAAKIWYRKFKRAFCKVKLRYHGQRDSGFHRFFQKCRKALARPGREPSSSTAKTSNEQGKISTERAIARGDCRIVRSKSERGALFDWRILQRWHSEVKEVKHHKHRAGNSIGERRGHLAFKRGKTGKRSIGLGGGGMVRNPHPP